MINKIKTAMIGALAALALTANAVDPTGGYSQTFTQWPTVEPGRLKHYGFNVNPSGLNLTILHQWYQHGWAQVVVSGTTNGVNFNSTNVVGWFLGSPSWGYDSAGTIIPFNEIYNKENNRISLKVTLFTDEALTTAVSGAKLTVKGESVD